MVPKIDYKMEKPKVENWVDRLEKAQVKKEDPKVKRQRFVDGIQAGQLRRLLKNDFNIMRETSKASMKEKQ